MRFSIENGNGFKCDVCKKEIKSKDAIHISAKILTDSTGAAKVISKMDMCCNCYIEILSKYAHEPRGKNKVHWSSLEKIRKRCGYLNSEIPTEVQTTNDNSAVDTIDREGLIEWLIEWDITPIIKNPLMRHIKGMPPVNTIEPKKVDRKCKWIKYDYHTLCPREHIDIDNPYWRIPEDRMKTLKYCPYCGKEIEVEL